ncbi:fibronectin type III domain-containing protein [Streptomyces sp. AS02]|uniref:fibronectin type III domain-containing protein n=1 Tax=Streptomyces sp. AS02 TaxID=2938946 RepID=UPI002020A086|nr:fibronectin type III domain-containing protein [Streptomyces sp. AS02]MCL8016570.1 fibronectin type III domain-containing protein [Streptomyces sp. AS02]
MHLRNRRTRIGTAASTAVFLAATSLLSAGAAAADGEKTMTADPLRTWQTDGIVWSLEYVRGVVYVGGSFGKVRPPGAKPGEKEVTRTNFAAFDAATGALLPCAHSFTGGENTVRALKASRDGKVLYVGGSFGKVDETGVGSTAALNTADCSLRKEFRPIASATVRAIETTDSAVYLGGDFTLVNNQTRNSIAAVRPDGSLLPFKADIDLPVRALVAAPEHGKILVGGDFVEVNENLIHALVALHPSTGATVSEFPLWLPARSVVKALTRDENNFYVAAEGRGTGVFDGRIAGRLSDNALLWKDNCRGATQAVAVHKGVVYSGSHAHNCDHTPGGFPEHEGGNRQHLLAQSAQDMRIQHWFPDTNGGTGEGQGPRVLEVAGEILWAGGEFTTVNEKPQQSLTRFAAAPDTGTPEAAPTLTVKENKAGKVTLGWRTAWDRDDAELTYRIYRDGVLVASPKQRSVWWNRPDMTYTDSVAPGSRHTYRIAVTDGRNTSPRSERLSVTAAAGGQ